ncbi:MAG: tail fiber protein [Pseudomonadota bacterium]
MTDGIAVGSRRRSRPFDATVDPDLAAALAAVTIPAGTIMARLSDIEPAGWLFCDGRAVSKGDYPGLFAIIGNQFGETTSDFVLPDLRDAYVTGAGVNSQLFKVVGENALTLTVENMPAHSHEVTDPGHSHSNGFNAAGSGSGGGGGGAAGNTGSASTGISISQTGGSQPFDNRPKSLACNFMIKT